jgi:hypothetical protein
LRNLFRLGLIYSATIRRKKEASKRKFYGSKNPKYNGSRKEKGTQNSSIEQ